VQVVRSAGRILQKLEKIKKDVENKPDSCFQSQH
jgi:hypothetical protein